MSFVHDWRIRRARKQLFGQLLFIRLVSGEVEPVAIQDQGCVFAGCADQGRRLQLCAPGCERWQAEVDLSPGALAGQAFERQADVSRRQGFTAERGGEQNHIRRLRIEALQAGDEGAFQWADRQV